MPIIFNPAAISPAGGDKVARTYILTVSDANNCGVPLYYYFSCSSDTNLQGCNDFLQLAFADPSHSSVPLNIGENEDFTIGFWICEINNPQNCSSPIIGFQSLEPLTGYVPDNSFRAPAKSKGTRSAERVPYIFPSKRNNLSLPTRAARLSPRLESDLKH